jgi:voltage-gated potassium channel
VNRVLKASLRPVRNLVVTIFSNIVICAILFELLEKDDHGPLGSLYWAFTTASTTGYGDLSPATLPGRLVGMWLMASSVALVAVVTAQIASALIQDPHLFSHEEQEEIKDDNKDQLLMLCMIMEKLGLDVPQCVEEYHTTERNANG